MSLENETETQHAQSSSQIEITNQDDNTTVLKDNKPELRKSQWTKLLLFVGLASTLGSSVPIGYSVTSVNSPAAVINSWCNETLIRRYDWHLSTSELDILWSAVVSTLTAGGMIGALCGAWAADRFGRKVTIYISVLLILIGSVLFLFCRMIGSVEVLLIGRFLIGLAAGLQSGCTPMYLCELAPLALRGTLAVFCPLGLTVGVLVGQIFALSDVFGNEKLWHVCLAFPGLLSLICFAPMWLYPESPTWLFVVKGDKDAAIEQLKKLRGNFEMELITKEIHQMQVEASLKQQASTFGEVLRNSKLLLPIILVVACTAGAQFSGINVIFSYSVTIFQKAGLTSEVAEWANLAAGILNLAVSAFQPMLMAKVNRRPLLLFSTLFSSLFMLTYTLMLYFIESVAWFAWGCIACIFLYLISFQIGLSPIPFFIGSELVEAAPRSVVMFIGGLSTWSCVFILVMAFPSMMNAWGPLVFLLFAISSALLFLLTMFYLPETRGRDPSAVAPLVANGFRSKVFKTQ